MVLINHSLLIRSTIRRRVIACVILKLCSDLSVQDLWFDQLVKEKLCTYRISLVMLIKVWICSVIHIILPTKIRDGIIHFFNKYRKLLSIDIAKYRDNSNILKRIMSSKLWISGCQAT